MEISSSFVGTQLRPLSIEITSRQAMNYAASVFDDNRVYFDDVHASGIVAHPMIACAITWAISRDFEQFLTSGSFPHHVRRQQVHYSESLTWHRPLRPGDRLEVTGDIVAIVPHRAGTHFVVRYRAVDQQGQPVFTEYAGAILRGVQCCDEGRGEENLPAVPRFAKSPEMWSAELKIHPLAAHIYDGCADMHFPIHSSQAFALSVGLPGIILHGTATLSYAVSELLRREVGNDPTRLQQLDCRFTGMVAPGSSVYLQLLGNEPNQKHADLFWQVVGTDGRPVISNGRLRVQID
ncbi:MAG: MaoC family dehydratase N-terminal domain-containing protein [Pirellulaceae bacterium]|nr:MaoC family dehydratase N-terminal domain-containing protein [Pirellulaceae bacterium]